MNVSLQYIIFLNLLTNVQLWHFSRLGQLIFGTVIELEPDHNRLCEPIDEDG